MKKILTILLIGLTATAVQAGPAQRAVKRDLMEIRADRREDVRDRLEDKRDARHQGGLLDKLEDKIDRLEDVVDRREDKFDRRHLGPMRKPRLRRACR